MTTLIEAEDRVARLDERARRSPLAGPWMRRLLYGEACASTLADGHLVHVSDLVLFDQGGFDGGPRDDLTRTQQTLRSWRKALRANAGRMLAATTTDQLAPGDLERPPELDAFWDEDWAADERLAAWRDAVATASRHPPLLAAAIAWDAWMVLQPDQRGPWRGILGSALILKNRGKTRHCLLPIDTGRRFSPYRRQSTHGMETRLRGFLEWCIAAAAQADKELDRMTLAGEALNRQIRGRRSSSRLPALVELFYVRPLLTVPAAAKALGCSQQAVDRMIDALGGSIQEMTGRARYRMWTLAWGH